MDNWQGRIRALCVALAAVGRSARGSPSFRLPFSPSAGAARRAPSAPPASCAHHHSPSQAGPIDRCSHGRRKRGLELLQECVRAPPTPRPIAPLLSPACCAAGPQPCPPAPPRRPRAGQRARASQRAALSLRSSWYLPYVVFFPQPPSRLFREGLRATPYGGSLLAEAAIGLSSLPCLPLSSRVRISRAARMNDSKNERTNDSAVLCACLCVQGIFTAPLRGQ
jgi:hypothetical protein